MALPTVYLVLPLVQLIKKISTGSPKSQSDGDTFFHLRSSDDSSFVKLKNELAHGGKLFEFPQGTGQGQENPLGP